MMPDDENDSNDDSAEFDALIEEEVGNCMESIRNIQDGNQESVDVEIVEE